MLEGLIQKNKEIVKKEEDILMHREAPKNLLQLQMALAEELYKIKHDGQEPNFDELEFKNELINYWIDTGYSKLFRLLVDEKERKQEDPMKISLKELMEFGKSQ